MLFGGAFPSGSVHSFSNGYGHEREEKRVDGGFSTLGQLMPIIVLILVSLLKQLMVSYPPYSLYRGSDFKNEHKGPNFQKVEKSVEEDYVSNIRNNCWKERQQKTDLLCAAKVPQYSLAEKAKSLGKL
uniref:DUF1977 domain-containing protein n=1 Tax=Anolis carolinensis TaxID=28377 RepID=A0A803SKR7_ANOCA